MYKGILATNIIIKHACMLYTDKSNTLWNRLLAAYKEWAKEKYKMVRNILKELTEC